MQICDLLQKRGKTEDNIYAADIMKNVIHASNNIRGEVLQNIYRIITSIP